MYGNLNYYIDQSTENFEVQFIIRDPFYNQFTWIHESAKFWQSVYTACFLLVLLNLKLLYRYMYMYMYMASWPL